MARIEPLMTVTEVSEYFRRSEKTIKRWVDDGDLKCSSVPKGEMMFDPDYIRSIGRVDFKVGMSSPEVYRLTKNYENKLKRKDEIISKLMIMVKRYNMQSSQDMIEVLSMTENMEINFN